MKTLGSLVTCRKGKPPKMDPDGRFPVLSPHYLRTGQIEEMAEPTQRDVVLRGGELILLWDGSNAGEFFRARGGILSSTMVVLEFDAEKTNPDYLFYDLKRFEPELKGRTAGSGIPHVDKEVLFAREIFDGDPDEQKAVATVLRKVDQAIGQTEELVLKQQRIKTGLMHDLLSRGIDAQGCLRVTSVHEFKPTLFGDIPAAWNFVRLCELCPKESPISYGVLKPGPFVPSGVPLLQIEDVIDGDIKVGDLHRISAPLDAQYARTRLKGGEIVVSLVGTIGKVASIPSSLAGANIHRNLARIEIAPPDLPAFVFYTLQSSAIQRAIRDTTLGSTQSLLNLSALRNIQIPRPPPEEQELIVSRILAQEEVLRATHNNLSKLLRIRAGLMADLLTGDVPVTPLLHSQSYT